MNEEGFRVPDHSVLMWDFRLVGCIGGMPMSSEKECSIVCVEKVCSARRIHAE